MNNYEQQIERRIALKKAIERTNRQIDALLVVQYNAANQLDKHCRELETARRELIVLNTPAVEIAEPIQFFSIDYV